MLTASLTCPHCKVRLKIKAQSTNIACHCPACLKRLIFKKKWETERREWEEEQRINELAAEWNR